MIKDAKQSFTFVSFRSEDEAEDVVDSDFSIDETDEVVSDNEETEEKQKRSSFVYKASDITRNHTVLWFIQPSTGRSSSKVGSRLLRTEVLRAP